MANLIQRPDSSTYYILYMVSGKAKRVSTETESLQIAKEKLRQFESAQARGDALPLPTRTPIASVVAAYVSHIRTAKTARRIPRVGESVAERDFRRPRSFARWLMNSPTSYCTAAKDASRPLSEVESWKPSRFAFVACSAIGLDARQCSADYIHLYRGSKQMLLESLQFIRQVSNDILLTLLPSQRKDGCEAASG